MNVLHSAKIALIFVFFLTGTLAAADSSNYKEQLETCAPSQEPRSQATFDKALIWYFEELSYVKKSPDNAAKILCIKFLIEQCNADVNQSPIGRFGERAPLIHYAASFGDLDLLKLFVTKNAKIDGRLAESQSTTLMTAIGYGASKEVLNYLIDHGASIDAKSEYGKSALEIAVGAGSRDAVEVLIKRGADYKQPISSGGGNTLIHLAAISPDSGPLEYLLSIKGTDPNIKNKEGETPLHMAAEYGRINQVNILLKKKADPNAKSDTGRTPLHYLTFGSQGSTSFESDVEIGKALIAAGADINAKTKSGETPLFYESDRPSRTIVSTNTKIFYPISRLLRFFLQNGADPTIAQEDGVTPAEFAEKNGDMEVATLLRRYERLQKIRDKYIKWVGEKPKPKELSKDDFEIVRDSMIAVFAKGAEIPVAPPKSAPESLRKVYDALKTAKTSPQSLETSALEIEGLPAAYYRMLLKAARAQAGKSKNKFKPSPDLAKQVVTSILQDPDSALDDHEMGAWLLGAANVPVDVKLLDLFSIPQDQLRREVQAMLALDAMKYDGNPNLAAIKLTKALLAYSDDDIGCANAASNKKSYLKNPNVEAIIEWLSQVGNLGTADKLLFARLARLVIEEKPNLCPAARNELIKAMRDWRVKDARVQAELVCATAYVIGEGGLEKKEYTDIMLIASAVGYQNDLSQSASIEQVCSLGKMTNEPGNDLYRETYLGLVRYIAGNPKGGFEMSKKEDGTIKNIPIDATTPRKDAVVKLCKIAADYKKRTDLSAEERCFVESFPKFLERLKSDLDKPRSWPTRFLVENALEAKTTLRDALGDKLKEDVQALETLCTVLPKKAVKLPPQPQKKKPLKGDFNP